MNDSLGSSETSLWGREVTCKALNALGQGNMMEHLGIEMAEVGANFLRATMPVDARTRQPFGLLHGGASVVLAETLGSVAAHCCLPDDKAAVGMEVNANHVRSVRSGQVTGTVRPVHVGQTTQVWQIRIVDEEERLVCISRLTMAVVDR